MTNINPTTGIRYGIISSGSVHSDILDRIYNGKDLHYEAALEDLRSELRRELDMEGRDDLYDETLDFRIEELNNDWQDDEPIYEFDIDGVKGRTTWLGGALLIWVFESPHTTLRRLCSPCVPGAGDLDSPEDLDNGWQCYDVPADWRDER